MATNSLQSLNYHHHQSPLKRHHNSTPDYPATTLFLKPATTTTTSNILSISSSTTTTTSFSLSSTTSSSITPSTSQPTTTFDPLQQHLSAQNFREADEETRRLLIALAGESAQKRGYVFFSEVQFISSSDLKTIDDLWKQYSNNKFGYSTQKKIWVNKCNKDFTRFFIKVGWMKKLDTEIDQYNYKAFPNEFIWVMDEETPEGHLPLTNALRGTQLLKCIFTHPAFDDVQEEEVVEERSSNPPAGGGFSKALSSNNSRQFKSDYSF